MRYLTGGTIWQHASTAIRGGGADDPVVGHCHCGSALAAAGGPGPAGHRVARCRL